ncbi:MAG TPA: hypothetical protein VI032_13290 [Burkholderiaceae bacterium]
MASLFERAVSALFGSSATRDDVDPQLIQDTTDAFVETVEPRVRLSSSYREKLAGNVARTLLHLRELGTRLPLEPLVLSRGAWSEQPQLRAFFASDAEVSTCIGRSDEVREFFESHAASDEAYALLGMQRQERTVFAPRLEGEVIKQDVQQTTVSFSGHRLLAAAPDLAQARLEVGRRIMQRLAQMALARIVSIDQQVQDLHLRKAKLATRLRMLRSARDGMAPLVGQGLTIEQQIRDAEREIKETSDDYSEVRSSLITLDGYIEQMNAVLAEPQQQLALAHVPLRVNRMGFKADAGQVADVDEIDLAELSIGEGLQATIAFVRIPRSELPPREDLLAQADRLL